MRNEEFGIGTVYLPPLQGEGEGLFANEEFARANKQNISQRQSASETVGQFRKKIRIWQKNA